MVESFWIALEEFVRSNSVVIDRPKGSRHPRVPVYVYPLDYGYVEGSRSGDGEEIDIWVGSGEPEITGAFCTFDPMNCAAELKVLWGVTETETKQLVKFYEPQPQRALFIERTQ